MPSKTIASPSNPAQLLDNQLCFALYSASLAMTKLYKPMLDSLGLTYPQYLVMLVLWEGDGPSISSLGERLNLDSGTLTPLLKRMEAAGWLVRQRSSEDERRVHVWLSPTGQQLQAQAAFIPDCVVTQSGLPLGELVSLKHKIQQLRDAMQAPVAEPTL